MSLTGLTTGTIISAKTLGMVVIIGGFFMGGLGIYSYINHENPLSLFGAVLKGQSGTTGTAATNQPITLTITQPGIVTLSGQSTGHFV